MMIRFDVGRVVGGARLSLPISLPSRPPPSLPLARSQPGRQRAAQWPKAPGIAHLLLLHGYNYWSYFLYYSGAVACCCQGSNSSYSGLNHFSRAITVTSVVHGRLVPDSLQGQGFWVYWSRHRPSTHYRSSTSRFAHQAPLKQGLC